MHACLRLFCAIYETGKQKKNELEKKKKKQFDLCQLIAVSVLYLYFVAANKLLNHVLIFDSFCYGDFTQHAIRLQPANIHNNAFRTLIARFTSTVYRCVTISPSHRCQPVPNIYNTKSDTI